ncbi:hypothetical protein Ddc_16793 [Ditylenchus destructor]|nr:hypothetical protein Ddc_16793 [Ditylenchus destructor]
MRSRSRFRIMSEYGISIGHFPNGKLCDRSTIATRRLKTGLGINRTRVAIAGASDDKRLKGCAICPLANDTKFPYCNACHKFAERALNKGMQLVCNVQDGRCKDLKKCRPCRYRIIKQLDYNFANGHKTADAASNAEDGRCEICRSKKDAQSSHCAACLKFVQRVKGKALACKKRKNGGQCNGVNGSLNYCQACRFRKILKLRNQYSGKSAAGKAKITNSPDSSSTGSMPEQHMNSALCGTNDSRQKRSIETSPDLLKGMCLPNAKEPTVNLQSSLQTPMTSLRTPSSALWPSSLLQVAIPCAQLPTAPHNQLQTATVGSGFVNYQALPYSNNQQYLCNPFQNDARADTYNYLHNHYWMDQHAHSTLQPGSVFENMGYFPVQNATYFPTILTQPQNSNGSGDLLSYANNSYNGMHVTNPAAGLSLSNSSISHGPTATQSRHADYSPSSSSGHTPGNPNSASLMPFNQTKVDGTQKRQSEQGTLAQYSDQCSGSSWPSKNELDVYLGPGHSGFQSETPMPSNTFAGGYCEYSADPVSDQLEEQKF